MHMKSHTSSARCSHSVSEAVAASVRQALALRHKPSRCLGGSSRPVSIGSPGNCGAAAFGSPNPSFERIHYGVASSLASVGSAAPLWPAQLQRYRLVSPQRFASESFPRTRGKMLRYTSKVKKDNSPVCTLAWKIDSAAVHTCGGTYAMPCRSRHDVGPSKMALKTE
jgi:hypothetical protein